MNRTVFDGLRLGMLRTRKYWTRLSLLGLVSSSLTGFYPAQAAANTLSVQVDGLRSRRGQVCLSVFNSSRGFPSQGDNALQKQCVRLETQQPTQILFNGLKAGSYAVAVLHDENDDQQANRNLIGIPTEGFGFSRNPALRAGPPRFSEAAFLVAGPNTSINIQMLYLF